VSSKTSTNVYKMANIVNAPGALACGVLLASLLGGCAVATAPPAPPAVVAVPGASKTYAAFREDDTACRAQANQPAAPPSGAAAAPLPPERVYANCMVARGNTLAPNPSASAAPPAGYAYPGNGYAPWAYGDPAFYGYWGDPFLFGLYGGGFYGGGGYYPGRYFAGHPYGFYHGGGFHGGGGRGGSFAARGGGGGFHGGGGGGGHR
jgi:hypothetical protein